MRMLRQVHNRLVLLLIFAVACIRVLARVLPISRTARAANRIALDKGIRRGLQVQQAGRAGRSYTLQATGAFPFVRISMSAPLRAVPVPVEIASLALRGASVKSSAPHALIQKTAPVCILDDSLLLDCCTDCTSCTGCTDCGGCTGCTSCTDCTCGTDCTDCSDCTTSDGVPI